MSLARTKLGDNTINMNRVVDEMHLREGIRRHRGGRKRKKTNVKIAGQMIFE